MMMATMLHGNGCVPPDGIDVQSVCFRLDRGYMRDG